MAHPAICIGTSGWSYQHWKGPFYPQGVGDEAMLAYYCSHFSSVEINNSFYHLPSPETLQQWYAATPENFRFAVKASRYITHMKKLKDPRQSLNAFFARIAALDDKLGPILFQLPPNWHVNRERLGAFLAALSRDYRYAFEFRDPSWFGESSYELFRRHGAALCIYELDGYVSPRELTADFVYLRLHGPDGPYQGKYDNRALSAWAGALSRWQQQGIDSYCYFDNDESGYAAQNALTLQAMLQQKHQGGNS